MFYPGPSPSPANTFPNYHYSLGAPEHLVPLRTPVQKTYKEYALGPISENSFARNCIHRNHPNLGSMLHQATPLYRLTLCERGKCEPDVHNTVYIAVNHAKKSGPRATEYGR
jgi:hypothetical protein